MITVRLREGDAEDFNSALEALRDEVAQAKEHMDLAAAEELARDDAAAVADGVRARMDELDRAANDATASNPDFYASSLDTIRSSLDTVKSSYEMLTTGAENGYGTVCDDAEIVADDIDEVRRQLFELEAVDPALLSAAAPTRAEVESAISAARRKMRKQGGRGADFDTAHRLLDQAYAVKAKADAACRASGG